MQSRIHERWARLLSSSLEDRLRYTTSDCFENFPFPQPDPDTAIPALEDIGKRLYEARAAFMLKHQVGLTTTYNLLKRMDVRDKSLESRGIDADHAEVVALRKLHLELDRAVCDAYGWKDLQIPPFEAPAEDDPVAQKALESFSDDVIDRLFELNARRAEAEKLGLQATKEAEAKPPPASKKRGGKKTQGQQEEPAPAKHPKKAQQETLELGQTTKQGSLGLSSKGKP